MITKGTELTTFVTGLNGGATIDATLLDVLVDNARAILEEERPWMVLRKVDTSVLVTTANTWQTAKSLATITDFSRLYGGLIRLFDGTNRVHYYRQVPFEERLEYKDASDTFVFDENANTIYLNGIPPFAGTLYIPFLATSTAINLASDSAVWTTFPSRFLPVLGYYAIGIFKGAVDYDSISKQMLPENRATLSALKSAMEKWDNERQLTIVDNNDPTDYGGYPRAGAILRD